MYRLKSMEKYIRKINLLETPEFLCAIIRIIKRYGRKSRE